MNSAQQAMVVVMAALSGTMAMSTPSEAQDGAPPPPTINLTVNPVLADEPAKVDDIKTFPLHKHGIVVGAGLGVHTGSVAGLEAGGTARLTTNATTPVAYLGLLPGYWWLKNAEETRTYCASYASEEKANAVAAKKAWPDATAKELRAKLAAAKASDGAERQAIKVATKGWDVSASGRCYLMMPGVFIARPADFNGNLTTDAGVGYGDREIRPVLTVGIMVAPKPYLHFLVGYTFSRTVPEEKGLNVHTGSWFFGIGTSIDAVAGAFK